MSKQDRQGARTPSDLLRQYILPLGKQIAEVGRVAHEAREIARENKKELAAIKEALEREDKT